MILYYYINSFVPINLDLLKRECKVYRSIQDIEYFDGILFNLCDGKIVGASARRHVVLSHSYCNNYYDYMALRPLTLLFLNTRV